MTFGKEVLLERRDELITGEVLNVDGCYFLNCRIIGCQVILRGDQNWGYDTGTVFERCTFIFAGRAQHILESVAACIDRDMWMRMYDRFRHPEPPPKAN